MSGSGLNGKTGELVRWVFGLVLAAMVAYFTAQGAVLQRVTATDVRTGAQFEEVQRVLTEIRVDIRELRREVREQ